jgi:hypothetical protein
LENSFLGQAVGEGLQEEEGVGVLQRVRVEEVEVVQEVGILQEKVGVGVFQSVQEVGVFPETVVWRVYNMVGEVE